MPISALQAPEHQSLLVFLPWTFIIAFIYSFVIYIYISLNSIFFNFACFWTLYKWYNFAYVLLLLFVFVRFIMLKGIAVVCLFSLLYNISFNVYTKIHLSSIHLVNVWVFSSFFAIPSHAVMKILIHVFWCTYPRVSLRYMPKVKFYLQFHYIMPNYF